MMKNTSNKIKYTTLMLISSMLVSCGGTQTNVAFYGYPEPSDYSVADNIPITEENNFAPINEDEDYTLSFAETEPLQIATEIPKATSTKKPKPTIYEVAGVQSPEELNAIAPASGGNVINTIPQHPATMVSKTPKCKDGATLAMDANNIPTCFTPAPDAEQACTDSSQCSSAHCVIDSKSNATKGQCFSLIPFTGCGSILVDGKIKKICS